MTPYNAARAAGYSKSYSLQKKSVIESQSKEELTDAFEQAGLTDKEIIRHAISGLNAMIGDQPNWTIRHKYLHTILELTDRLKNQINIDNSRHYNNVFLSEGLKKARMRINASALP